MSRTNRTIPDARTAPARSGRPIDGRYGRRMNVPVPPIELIKRVTGQSEESVFRDSGPFHLDAFARALALVHKSYSDFASVLDFGCGCGRLTLPLVQRLPHARIAASDTDREAVAWLADHAPGADVRANDPLPPLSFDDDSFDLVLVWSLFTHLPESYQDAWLAELHRVTATGGIVLVSVHGASNWRWTWQEPWAGRRWKPARLKLALERKIRGFAHWRDDGWNAYFPDYYHTTFHTDRYIRRHFSRWFDVSGFERGAGAEHDIVVLEAKRC